MEEASSRSEDFSQNESDIIEVEDSDNSMSSEYVENPENIEKRQNSSWVSIIEKHGQVKNCKYILISH